LQGKILLVGLLLQMASILDGVDGEVARQKRLYSRFSALLDTVVDYWIDSVGIAALGLALLRSNMMQPEPVLLLVPLTIAIRIISNFVAKNASFKRPHIYRDTRDVVTFLIFISALLTGLLKNPMYIAITLMTINLWRLDNMLYRLYKSWKEAEIEARGAHESAL
jgi:phosphatidylglycerophosphate synthase